MTVTLINRVCMRNSTGLFYLPPFSRTIEIAPLRSAPAVVIPHASGDAARQEMLENRRVGHTISIKGRYAFATVQEGLDFQSELQAFLEDSNGLARTVDLCRWLGSGTDETRGRFYNNCELEDGPYFSSEVPGSDRRREFSFTLWHPYIAVATAFADASAPTVGPYEAYYLNGVASEAAGTVVTAMTVRWIDNVIFSGVADAITDANNILTRQKRIYPGRAITIKSLQIVGTGSEGTGNTTAVVSTAAWNGAGTTASATVAAAAAQSTRQACDIDIGAAASFYVYLSAAGGHSDVQVRIEVEEA